MVQSNWIDDQRKKAELEAQRERVRQAFAALNNTKTSTWIQGLMYLEGAKNVDDLKGVCRSFNIVWKDEGDMVTKNVELASLKAELAKVQAKIDRLEHGRLGKEPANGTVFKVERRFDAAGKGYSYAAVRADGKWYITGTRGDAVKAMDWEEFKRWVGKYSRVWSMTVREELVD